MTDIRHEPQHGLDDHAALRSILEGTASETGERVFAALVEHLSLALKTSSVWVTQVVPGTRRLKAAACWRGGQLVPPFEYEMEGSPCQRVIEGALPVHIVEGLAAEFPKDPGVGTAGGVGYMGLPLLDLDGRVLGHLAVLDVRPMPKELRSQALIRIFAARAAAELQRLRAESQVREDEEKLGRLVDSAAEAVIELDEQLFVTGMNRAAEHMFGCPVKTAVGRDFGWLLSTESRERLAELAAEFADRAEQEPDLKVGDRLTAVRADHKEFPAEATLSRFAERGKNYFALLLHDVKQRYDADRKIHSLTVEAEYLKEEVRELHNFDEIIGRSQSLRRVLADVNRAAPTDTSVLIQGETGTGKGLIARAIHAASPRSESPFVRFSCAATPEDSVERALLGTAEEALELFGGGKGPSAAGPTQGDGRLALADGGTLFLDEVGHLSPELQETLARVLQAGEFTPLGADRPRRVNLRLVASSAADLEQEVEDGRFREDLYHRLAGATITLPPLRDRRDDIPILATAFAQRLARRMGRTLEPISPDHVRRLRAYAWPGNVRELQNVIERAVITSPGSRLDLDRALPEPGAARPQKSAPAAQPAGPQPVRTAKEMLEIERANLIRGLDACDWTVAGDTGAAKLLGLKPSTLTSRMKALKIKRPRK
jgi:PAS domain S-box-containing protein